MASSQSPLAQDQLGLRQRQQPLSQEHDQEPRLEATASHAPSSSSSSSSSPSTLKTYEMLYTASRTNVRLHLGSSTGPCIYYGESALMSINKPQMLLRLGDSKSAPTVAFAKFQLTSRHVMIGSGDHEKDAEGDLVWEELHRVNNVLQRSDYEFSTPAAGLGQRRTYRWRRDMAKLGKDVYECVDETGRVVAQMLSGGFLNWNKGGEMKVLEGLDERLERMLMISGLAIWTGEALGAFMKGYPSKEDHDGAGGSDAARH